uniref:Uncharacterized protein n=1 Tax=Pichia angusta TaxID=870730 RepID=Q9HFM6_PICAN|nr:hypothetical protein [Ogataea angusta]
MSQIRENDFLSLNSMQHATSQTRPSKERRLRYTGYELIDIRKLKSQLPKGVARELSDADMSFSIGMALTSARSFCENWPSQWSLKPWSCKQCLDPGPDGKIPKKKMPFGDKLGDPESD